ncbi:MAG: hypothetical protein JNL41_05660 [Phenylobacterium sp.]|uniref:hypothetical protein n=1 Tax=Phenylobacterium sp. TaxID=1871053 RepID=UPI001A63607C|nr:hypothetical protein [Phenylobacterium sp.]MBL8553744.1 hypothetical protein [Phenylobacterium sp.]
MTDVEAEIADGLFVGRREGRIGRFLGIPYAVDGAGRRRGRRRGAGIGRLRGLQDLAARAHPDIDTSSQGHPR